MNRRGTSAGGTGVSVGASEARCDTAISGGATLGIAVAFSGATGVSGCAVVNGTETIESGLSPLASPFLTRSGVKASIGRGGMTRLLFEFIREVFPQFRNLGG